MAIVQYPAVVIVEHNSSTSLAALSVIDNPSEGMIVLIKGTTTAQPEMWIYSTGPGGVKWWNIDVPNSSIG